MQPRWYQTESVDSCFSYLRNESTGGPVIVLPTGAGKSLVLAMISKRVVEQYSRRVLIVAHRSELLTQNAEKVRALLPGKDIGIYSAGLNKRDTNHDIVCCGIQSVHKRAHEFGERHLVLIDEVHLVPSDGEGMYRTFLGDLKAINPDIRFVGLTATPFRTGEGRLTGKDKLFQKIVYSAPLTRLIDEGFLSQVTNQPATATVDTSKLHIRAGEFIASEVESLFNSNAHVEAACQELVALSADRKSILVFCSGVNHAEHVKKIIEELTGDEVGIVTGQSGALERAATLRRFKERDLRWCVNVDVLTTGFDAPNIDCVAVLRATLSPGLFAQMVGRGLRKSPDKTNCIAEGQRVLTDYGLIEIQLVTTHMKVWDGIEFVSHSGIILRGELPVITYAGLTATEDHNVWTKKGWMPFGDAKLSQTEICVTGNDGLPIREVENYFRSDSKNEQGSSLRAHAMRAVRKRITKGLRFCSKVKSWLQKVRQNKQLQQALSWCPEMAANEVHFGEAQMRKQGLKWLQGLRWERDSVSIQQSEPDGSVANDQFQDRQEFGDRQDRQQWPLRSWKHKACSRCDKCEQPTKKQRNQKDAQVQDPASGNKLCRRNNCKPNHQRIFIRRDSEAILQEVDQAKRRVWDIVNAGPRNRFTCEGLLVSNCVILDFGENLKRHGPIDSPTFGMESQKSGTGTGDAVVKICPACRADVFAGSRECECGFVFPPRDDGRHDGKSDQETALLASQMKPSDWYVVSCIWGLHRKRQAGDEAPPTLRISYTCQPSDNEAAGDLSTEIISEWVCLQHEGFARTKAVGWWLQHSKAPVPNTIAEAVSLLNRGAAAMPTHIRAKREGKFWKILSQTIDELPDEWEEEPEKTFDTEPIDEFDTVTDEVPF
jgi:superfamily II DNA or RNA helicase